MTEIPDVPRDRRLPAHLAMVIARAGVDPTIDSRAIQDELRYAIAGRRGYIDWIEHAHGWRVRMVAPQRVEFDGATLQEALAWCLVWLLGNELGTAAASA